MIKNDSIIRDTQEIDKYINQLKEQKQKLELENLKKRQLIEKLKEIINEQNK